MLRLFVLLALLWPVVAGADVPPRCSAEIAGAAACLGHKICLCSQQRRGADLVYAWDCGILRPYCPRPPQLAEPYLPHTAIEVELDRLDRRGRKR